MSTYLGHVMPKRTMSKSIEKMRQKYNTICRSEPKHSQIAMLCIQDDHPDVKYMSRKNKYAQLLAVTKQLPVNIYYTLYEIYIQEATHQVWA